MTIEEKAIKTLNEIIDEGWLISDMEKCDAIDACEFAIDRIHKYQKIQEVLEKVWNVPSCMLDEADCLNKIMETYRTVR